MAQPLTKENIQSIIHNSLKHQLGAIRSQLDGVKIEMKVMREEVKNVSCEMVAIKQRLDFIEA